MPAPNGRPDGGVTASANGADGSTSSEPARKSDASGRLSADQINCYTAELEIPFDPDVIEWRVINTSQGKSRGQVIPYADQRAYTDRLNALFTPAGWTRRYTIHTSANFQRGKDQKIVAKVLVACELTIFGLGSHCATGEEWADDDNAGTSAEAQAFKRACSCFGLGRYLYHFAGQWVDLDERKRPKTVPRLQKWATPEGWLAGLRPRCAHRAENVEAGSKAGNSSLASLLSEIEAMAKHLGTGLYRGLLRDLARVWNPHDIEDRAVQRRVLEHMRAAQRGLRRLEAALEETGPEALIQILKSAGLGSLERVDNLETLKQIVVDLERIADNQA